MYVTSITERGSMPALVQTMSFNEARLRVIAENVANGGTVGYRARQLDAKGFQKALRRALDDRGGNPARPLVLRDNGQVATDAQGRLKVTPTEAPAENVLFHDGTNLSIERQMSDLAETQLSHQTAGVLLKDKFDGLRKAIRGQV